MKSKSIQSTIFLLVFAANFSLLSAAVPTTPVQLEKNDSVIVSEELNNSITEVNVFGNLVVNIVKGSDGISLSGTQSAIDKISINTSNNTLSIMPSKKKSSWITSIFDWRSHDNSISKVNITVSLPNLQSLHLYSTSRSTLKGNDHSLSLISLSGASWLEATDTIYGENLQVDMRGYTKFTVNNIEAKQVKIHQSGSSTFEASTVNSNGEFNTALHGQSMSTINSLLADSSSMKLSGQSRVYIDNIQLSSTFKGKLYGASSANITNLATNGFNISMLGGSSLDIKSGQANTSQLSLNGKSHLTLHRFQTGDISTKEIGSFAKISMGNDE